MRRADRLDVVAAGNELLRLRPVQHTRVLCVSGTIWLTQENDGRDVILEAGERYDLAPRGLVLISAFSPEARVRMWRATGHFTIEGDAGTWRQRTTGLLALVMGCRYARTLRRRIGRSVTRLRSNQRKDLLQAVPGTTGSAIAFRKGKRH